MSLLKKTNTKATAWSVFRRALLTGVLGASVYLLAKTLKGSMRDASLLGLAVWTGLCMCIGGLFEWQVPDDDAESDDG
jgi:hypothetical protein